MAVLAAGGRPGHQVLTVVQFLDAGRDTQAVGAGGIFQLNRVAIPRDRKGGAQFAIHLVAHLGVRCLTQCRHQTICLTADDITDAAALIDTIEEIAAPLISKPGVVIPEGVTDGA
ncbi:hypothetical protein D3C72_2085840 [compost metagenome]